MTAWLFDPSWSDPEAEVWWQVRDLDRETPLAQKLKRLAALTPTLVRMSRLEAAAVLEDLKERLKLRAADLAGLRADCCGSVKEVRLCPVEACTLHPYRLGKRPLPLKIRPDSPKPAGKLGSF